METLKSLIQNKIPNTSTANGCKKSYIDAMNVIQGGLRGYNCDKCKNKGIIYYEKDGYEYFHDCECMTVRRSIARIERSGLKNALEKCTFENYEVTEQFQQYIKAKASDYLSDFRNWFYIGGQVGCGKTHICTAIVGELLNQGKAARYMQWRDDVVRIKSNANTDDYSKLIEPFKCAEVLYIDDLFKTEKDKTPTTADINIAFEILNHRYINQNLITIISSEKTIEEIINIDEAVGSRIYEMSKKYCICIKPDRNKNYRLRGAL